MPLHRFQTRMFALAYLPSLLLLALCGVIAVTLAVDQTRTAEVLGEDIGSRGAAMNLEATLNNLAVLLDRRSQDVPALHSQVQQDLAEIDRFADKERERELARAVAARWAEYLTNWEEGAAPAELAAQVRDRVLPAAAALRTYNGQELIRSEEGHREAIRRVGWGLALVGGLGAIAGAILGYAIARGVQRTIHQFLVRVQGATDRLGRETAEVEWQRVGDTLADGADDLLHRVEQVVSKLQQREREVRRAERLAAVGQLAAGVAHEIRNPLTSAVLLLETARKDPAAGGLTDGDLDMVEAELHRIERSLQTFLDYARPPKLQRTRVDLVDVVRDALGLARGRIELQRVKVELDAPPGGCRLEADREQLRQVALNLILNALDVMPSGGTLGISVRGPGPENTIELAVTDTGPGIRADLLPRLFEPFATGKETGLGLGLVVTKRIAEDHGGAVAGENLPGRGARFTLRLPTAASRS